MTAPIAFFRVGSKAVCIQEISHWWVASAAVDGPALCVSMRNGKQVMFDKTDSDSDGFAIEISLIKFIESMECFK